MGRGGKVSGRGSWRRARAICTLAGCLLVGLLAVGDAAAATDGPQIHVLSNRSDLISAGDALVAIDLPDGSNPSAARVILNGSDVTDAFAPRPNGRYEGLVEGLALGSNQLGVRVPGAGRDQATIVNHPNGGPVFAGPQIQPWQCDNEDATDKQCNAPTTFRYQYMSTAGRMQTYDPANPPSDVATTTTDRGKTVPFIIRTETSYQDRDQYKIALLYQPGKDWRAWAPQPQWNHKLLITHGASCGIDHKSGSAPSVTGDTTVVGGTSSSSPTVALGRGFAVMSTALDNAGHN